MQYRLEVITIRFIRKDGGQTFLLLLIIDDFLQNRAKMFMSED